MEEKKLDINSIIGFVLIFGILVYMMYQNTPTPEELEAQKQAEQEQDPRKRHPRLDLNGFTAEVGEFRHHQKADQRDQHGMSHTDHATRVDPLLITQPNYTRHQGRRGRAGLASNKSCVA